MSIGIRSTLCLAALVSLVSIPAVCQTIMVPPPPVPVRIPIELEAATPLEVPKPKQNLAPANIGISSVAGAWGYQGARATVCNGTVHNTQLTYVNSVDAESGKVKWTAEAKGKFITGRTQVFSPPAMGKQNMYLCSGDGHLVCIDESTGQVKFMYNTHQPISFQPSLAKGRIFIGAANGMLMSINSADPSDADGWTAWGGNAQHNKVN